MWSASPNFNPRSPHGERRNLHSILLSSVRAHFNPRSPHGERRSIQRASFSALLFQSTLPARGATGLTRTSFSTAQFQSTLPARGATEGQEMIKKDGNNFNPRSPHGERPTMCRHRTHERLFQSTLPARGATRIRCFCPCTHAISIHAPRTGSDHPKRADDRGR